MKPTTMTILGIETSCDETGAAVVRGDTATGAVTLVSNALATSLALHAQTGGIIPEVAAREQLKFILPVIDKALADAGITVTDLDAIAVTHGPGLIGSLLVGVETAKTLAYLHHLPLIPVNHLYGHIYANWLMANSAWHRETNKKHDDENLHKLYAISHKPIFPALALVVSGGHTDLVLLHDHGKLEVIGGTRDDAAGEAFDKIGRLLGLQYPAGPIISQLAKEGDPKAFRFPRPLIGSDDYDFSFSGLKTAVLREIKALEPLPKETIVHLCASVEEAIIDILVRKTLKAAEQYKVKSILLGGGVAANTKLRERFSAHSSEAHVRFFAPPKNLCTDNAAMIAAAAWYHRQHVPWETVTAAPELYY